MPTVKLLEQGKDTLPDWVSYTPNWTANTTNPVLGNGSISGKWRRVGDSIEISIGIQSGSTTTFGSGAWRFSYPSGFTLNSSKIESATGIPISGVAQGNPGGNTVIGSVECYSTLFQIRGALLNGAAQWSSSFPVAWSTGQIITLNARIPVNE